MIIYLAILGFFSYTGTVTVAKKFLDRHA